MRAGAFFAAAAWALLAPAIVAPASAAGQAPGYVLAASWEPAFCASDEGDGKRECRTQTSSRYDATHLSLHGLWPDNLRDRAIFPCYCGRGAPADCHETLPDGAAIRLSQPVFDALRPVMPGVQSRLHRHEWAKHGSCAVDGAGAALDPDTYFSAATRLVTALNDSAVGALFADNVGKALTRGAIEAAFDEAFGNGAAARVVIACDGRGADAVIAELRINLAGDITDGDLGAMILAAPPATVSTSEQSCAGGVVAAVAPH